MTCLCYDLFFVCIVVVSVLNILSHTHHSLADVAHVVYADYLLHFVCGHYRLFVDGWFDDQCVVRLGLVSTIRCSLVERIRNIIANFFHFGLSTCCLFGSNGRFLDACVCSLQRHLHLSAYGLDGFVLHRA